MKKCLLAVLLLSFFNYNSSFASMSVEECRHLGLLYKTTFELRKNGIPSVKACITASEKVLGSRLSSQNCETVNSSLDIVMDVAANTAPEEVEKAIFLSCMDDGSKEAKRPLPKSKDDCWNLLKKLADKMYVIGETTGKIESFRSEETIAAYHVLALRESNPESLIQENESGQTPLMAAATLGYARVVNELLRDPLVRNNINKKDKRGMTALDHARFAKRQAIWACNPSIFENPFAFVPYYVTKEYYDTESPYQKISEKLKAAGANSNEEASKTFWLDACSGATEDSKTRVAQSQDMLSEVLKLGGEVFDDYTAKKQKNK